MPIYVICDYYIHKTALSRSSEKMEIFVANTEIFFTFRIREFTTRANQIPCVFPVLWQNFQIPCVFPDRDFFWPFSLFSLWLVPCQIHSNDLFILHTCLYTITHKSRQQTHSGVAGKTNIRNLDYKQFHANMTFRQY